MLMASVVKWSPDFLFREVPGPSATIRFLYPSREVAFAFLLGAFLGVAALAHWSPSLSPRSITGSLQTVVAALFVAVMAGGSIRAIWDQRVLLVDPGGRELKLLRRSPFRTRLQSVDFSELRRVVLLDPNPSNPNSERCYRVSLLTASGSEIHLGKERRTKAIAFAYRLAELIGLPVERSMQGT
jgi:hypothetical protein